MIRIFALCCQSLACCILLSLAACSKKVEEPKADVESVSTELIKAAADTKRYKALELENGMRVLLISDDSANKAAVSLNVDVGSGADPLGREGLAHFVEHMLFLGTKKYPEADAYQRFISENGGSHNAYTAFEDTNYFFDVEPAKLEEGLDRFSQFFIDPLFTEQYLNRERQAVNSEYRAKIDNEMRRFLDVFKSQINPDHPFSKFSVGTLDTLNPEGLRDAVKAFYEAHYYAQNMSVVILGREPIDTLESWVKTRLEKVEKKPAVPRKNLMPALFEEEALPRQVTLKPLQNTRSLSLNFPIEDLSNYKLEKPTQLIGHLFGHEGEGSLFDYLKSKGLVESLSAGLFLDYPGGAMFSINIQLTQDGFAQKDAVIQQVFATQKLIQAGIEAWRYDELARVSTLQFDFQPNAQPINYVRAIAASMSDFPQAYWLSGAYTLTVYDADISQRLVQSINPSNMLLIISDPEAVTDKVSTWYSVPYRSEPITPAMQTQWRSALLAKAIALPPVNPFIPTSLALSNRDTVATKLPSSKAMFAWYVNHEDVDEPRAYTKAMLSNSQWSQTVQQAVAVTVAAKLIDDAVNKALYEAKTIGYTANVSANTFGLSFTAYGFNEKLPVVVEQMIDRSRNISWNAADFSRAKAEIVRTWQNASLEPAYVQLSRQLAHHLTQPSWAIEEQISALSELNFDQFLNEWQALQQFDHLSVLVAGNVSDSESDALLHQWSRLTLVSDQSVDMPRMQVSTLPVGARNEVIALATSADDEAVVRYIQSPITGIEGRALAALTVQLFESGFYHELRTEQQFGYIVYMTNQLLGTTPGVSFVVQSPRYSGPEITAAIDQYLTRVLAKRPIVDADTFESVKSSLIHNLRQPPTSVSELGSRAWRSLVNGSESFDDAEKIAQRLDNLSYQEWQEYAVNLLSSGKARQLDLIAEPES